MSTDILFQLPIKLNTSDCSYQISERINLILEPFRGLRGAKTDFVACFPEYNTTVGGKMLNKAFTTTRFFCDFRLWICLESWVEDVKKRKPDWYIQKEV